MGTWPLQMREWEGCGGNVSKLLLLLRAKVRKYYRRDRSGEWEGCGGNVSKLLLLGKDGGNVSKLLLLLCAKVRNYYGRDRSGTAAGPQNVGIPTIPGWRRDRYRRRRDHFTCKFIGAGPHTPFGNYNNIPGGVRCCVGSGVWEASWGDVLSI